MFPRKRPVPGFAFRTRELDRLRDAIEGGASVVTLTGAPGIGKTALLLQWLATAGLEAAGWHVLFVDGASCLDVDALITKLLELVGVDSIAGSAESALIDILARTPTIVVIDGLDPVSRIGSSALERWLANAPELAIIVTSRERLASRAEHRINVPPLDRVESEALLLQCLGDLDPSLRDTVARDPALPRLLEALGGIPLAIELAAARCRFLSPGEIAQRQHLGLGEAIESAIASSITALSPMNAAKLGELSIFENEFDLETAHRVAREGTFEELLDVVQVLHDASMLDIRHEDSQRLISLLPPIRAHVRRTLEASAERESAILRHRRWVFERGEELIRQLRTASWQTALDALRALRADLMAAFHHARERHAPEAFRLLFVLDDLLEFDASRGELIPAFDDLLTWTGIGTSEEHALTALRRAEIGLKRGELSLARTLLDRVENECGQSARWITTDAYVRLMQGQIDDASSRLERAVEEAKNANDRTSEMELRTALVEIHRQKRRGQDAVREGVHALLLTGPGNPRNRASILTGLSFAASEAGETARAAIYAKEGLELLERCTSKPSRTRSGLQVAMGRAAHLEGDLTGAIDWYQNAQNGPDPAIAIYSVAALGSALVCLGRVHEARDQWRRVADDISNLDSMYGSICTALLGALEARLGEPELGQERIRQARIRAGARIPPFVGALFDACEDLSRSMPLCLEQLGNQTLAIELSVLQHLNALATTNLDTHTLPHVRELRLSMDGAWFRVGNRRIPSGQRPVMRRILLALAHSRLESPGRSLSRHDLLHHGWGDERMLESSARRRLEVMISRIRALGIGDALQTTEDGYRIHEGCVVVLEGDEN